MSQKKLTPMKLTDNHYEWLLKKSKDSGLSMTSIVKFLIQKEFEKDQLVKELQKTEIC